MSFFQIFHEKPHAGMPIFGQKNVNFVKTTINYGPKKSKGYPFVSYFHEKISTLMPIFCQKNAHSKKITLVSCPYFVKKTSIISKTRCSHVIFFNFFMKNPCCHTHIWSKKHQFCQNYTILWDKKVNRIPVLLIFHQKVTALMPDFCQKNAHSLKKKNTPLSCPYFIGKSSIFSKTHCSHVILVKFCMRKPLLLCTYLVKKTSIL